MSAKVEVLNFTSPGNPPTRVDAAKFNAMRDAILAGATHEAPGMTVEELYQAAAPHLPEALFPGGATGGWWLKCAQLDMEARGEMRRVKTKPLRLHLTGNIAR
jgi:hypothetical protein